jgi:hypothetical protein
MNTARFWFALWVVQAFAFWALWLTTGSCVK